MKDREDYGLDLLDHISKFSVFSYTECQIFFVIWVFFPPETVKTVWDDLALVFHFILLIICCTILSSDILR